MLRKGDAMKYEKKKKHKNEFHYSTCGVPNPESVLALIIIPHLEQINVQQLAVE